MILRSIEKRPLSDEPLDAIRVPADRDVDSHRMTQPNVAASTRPTRAAATEWDEWKAVRDVG
ncbi:hypothetical protein C7T35_17690 [Variovorax sp. WS11]|uniref:hypothetical protein n=1 Tax=Variovorax sp. WS11 TaxID=1105204 RepID=UPI000D0D2336|nr:hypothetical protein [Variovorax sp. WS11]NDZ16070.1 hypothetical protein [Variovorax sp. WS11]PSL83253.1 hypothetical protein C7T35_17690 [Variovorax sp. WS11]